MNTNQVLVYFDYRPLGGDFTEIRRFNDFDDAKEALPRLANELLSVCGGADIEEIIGDQPFWIAAGGLLMGQQSVKKLRTRHRQSVSARNRKKGA